MNQSPDDPGCQESMQWGLFLDGHLDEGEGQALAEHLNQCERCQNLVAARPGHWSALEQLDHLTAPILDRETIGLLSSLGRLDLENPEPTVQQSSSALAAPPRVPAKANQADPELEPTPEIPGLVDLVELGQGGMARVYRAHDLELDRRVAVKVIGAGTRALLSTQVRERARREAQALAKLNHPHVVQIYRSGEVNGVPYLVMELVTGGTLQQQIATKLPPIREAAQIVRELADAVEAAHALGIIHRDLKPSNVLLSPGSQPQQPASPKLADFGLARSETMVDQRLTESGLLMGTPSYMAPEQVGDHPDQQEIGPATDVHGLGTMLYALLTGRPPYDGASQWESLLLASHAQYRPVQALRGDVPRDLRTIVDKCLQASPRRRYSTAAELVDDLNRFLDRRPILARSAPFHEHLAKWCRRKPTTAALVLVLTLAGITAGIGVGYHLRSMSLALTRAETAVTRAEAAVGKQQDLLGTFHHQVVQRLLQRGTALNEEDLTFLKQIREQYLAWPLEPRPVEALQYRAAGLRQLGNIFFNLEHYLESHGCRMDAVAAIVQALSLEPSSLELRGLRARTLLEAQMALVRTDQFASEDIVNAKLLTELEGLAERDPGERLYLAVGLITLTLRLADLEEFDQVRTLVPRAIQQADRYLAEHEQDLKAWNFVPFVYYNAGFSLDKAGDTAQKEPLFRKMLALGEEGARRFPQSPLTLIKAQQSALIALADLTYNDKRWAEAETTLDQLIQVCRHGIEQHPEEKELLEFQGGLIDAALLRAKVDTAQNQPAAALPDMEQAIELARSGRERQPAVFDRSLMLIRVLLSSAKLHQQTGKPDQARQQFDEVSAIAVPWLAHPDRGAEVQRLMDQASSGLINLEAKAGNSLPTINP